MGWSNESLGTASMERSLDRADVADDELLPMAQAYRRSGISLYKLRRAIAEGRLKARNVPRRDGVPRWLIPVDELDRFAASKSAPAARNGELPLHDAMREYGLSRQTMKWLIDAGLVEARNARQAHDGPGHQGDRWMIVRESLDSFIASCPVCAWPGCERPGVTPAGRCSRSHSGPLDRRKSPETRAKISAARMGQRKGVPLPHTPEWDEHIGEGIRAFWADAERSQERRQAKSEELRGSWVTGEGAAAGYIKTKSGRTRQRLFGRWAGQSAGRAAGRKRGYTDLQAKGLLEFSRANPTFGYRRLAKACHLTDKQVRAILADDRNSS